MHLALFLLVVPLVGCTFYSDPNSTILTPRDSGLDDSDLSVQKQRDLDNVRMDAETSSVVMSESFVDPGDGEANNTAWLSGRLRATDTGRVGTYTTRPFVAPAVANWTVTWRPQAPYGRPLPINEGSDGGYPTGNLDMVGNELLLEFDGPQAAFQDGEVVTDLSGRQTNANAVVSTLLVREKGVFGESAGFRRDDRFELDSQRFDYGTADFTWSFFAKASDCSGRQLWMGSATQRSSEVWIGCASDPICPLGNGLIHLIKGESASGSERCASVRFDDDRWHHIAMIKRGHPNVATEVYLDGEAVFTNNVAFLDAEGVSFDGSQPFGIGSVNGQGAIGTIDTVAIWSRALDLEEIQAIHDRGLLDVTVEVRACDDAECVNEPEWRSTDANLTTPVQDPFDGTGVASTTLDGAEFVQVRVTLGPNGNRTPEVGELTISFETVP